jgi:Tfp pilus assembly protein FimV
MTTLTFLLGVALGGMVFWRLATERAAGIAARARAEMNQRMRQEVRHWQEAAERATAEAARVAREAESWQAGRKQGRDDVISIVPLLVATQQWPAQERKDGFGAADDRDCG